jgi:heat shock protein HtpX
MPPVRSLIALALFGSCYALLALWLGGVNGLLAGLVLLGGTVLFWSEHADRVVLSEPGPHGSNLAVSPEIAELLARLSDKAGLPVPRLHVVSCRTPNACTIGVTPIRSTIVVTSALLTTLSQEELAAVFAHEAHIRNRDTLTMTVILAITLTITVFGEGLTLFGLTLGRGRGWPMQLLGILVTLFSGLAALAVSRSHEYRADRLGATICDHPEWLIAALQKLDRLGKCGSVPASLFRPAVVPMLFADIGLGRMSDHLWSTHPPVAMRIARLAALPPA